MDFILDVETLASSLMQDSNSDSAKAATANYANRQPPFPNAESPICRLLLLSRLKSILSYSYEPRVPNLRIFKLVDSKISIDTTLIVNLFPKEHKLCRLQQQKLWSLINLPTRNLGYLL